MANKKNSKYEKPGGMKKGRIGVGIFIVAAVIADTVMIRGYMNGGKSATLGAMIILMTIVYLTVAVSLIRLIIRMEKQMAADEQEQTEAEEQTQKAGKGAAYKSLKKKSRNK